MKKFFPACLLILFAAASCNKQDNFKLERVTEYFPLYVGYITTYDLDSTVFTNFGQTLTTRHYQAQYQVYDSITDNNGRKGFTIRRYLRADSTQPWSIDNVFTAYATGNSLEYLTDNLRFIKLVLPFENGTSWNGNSYLPFNAYPSYEFANPGFTQNWNYTYTDVNTPALIGDSTFANSITVLETADSTGDPNIAGTQYAEKTHSVEKYAKNIGLIFKDYFHWEYQGNTNTYLGFGERLSIIGHN